MCLRVYWWVFNFFLAKIYFKCVQDSKIADDGPEKATRTWDEPLVSLSFCFWFVVLPVIDSHCLAHTHTHTHTRTYIHWHRHSQSSPKVLYWWRILRQLSKLNCLHWQRPKGGGQDKWLGRPRGRGGWAVGRGTWRTAGQQKAEKLPSKPSQAKPRWCQTTMDNIQGILWPHSPSWPILLPPSIFFLSLTICPALFTPFPPQRPPCQSPKWRQNRCTQQFMHV